MEKKPVLPFAAVLAIAAGWLFFTRGGHQDPIPLDIAPSSPGSRTGTKVTVQAKADPANDEEREKRLAELVREEDSALLHHADVHRIHCEGLSCTIEASAKADPGLLRRHMEKLLEEHPWLGTRMDTSEGPADDLSFTFHREAAPSPRP